jgi:hypothetical protein
MMTTMSQHTIDISDHQEDNEITSTSHDTNESAKSKSRKSQRGKDKS